ncbi:MAG: DciA family protein [Methylococcales bacterium]|nr:DciA family protein [Methylococcales bacterium]MDD5753383.1 DciA family protein [Methylococcales bacterium]
MSFKAIVEFHNQSIDKLRIQVEQQKDMLMVVRNVLPETLAGHALHCVIHDAMLLIYTDAAVWSSQLRFYQTEILTAISPFAKTPVKHVQIRLVIR